jgi:hypothetical protein
LHAVGGDSGAWVIDNDSGNVCGHVLAWCERWKIAYICPADVILEDMQRTLGANRICLPGSSVERSVPARRRIAATAASSGADSGQLSDEVARLGLGGGNMLSSRLNGSPVSPSVEVRRVFGGNVA